MISNRAAEPIRHVHEEGPRSPEDAGQLVEEENQPEGGQHLIQVISVVEPPQCHQLDRHADQGRRRQGRQQAEQEGTCQPGHAGRHERPNHVERAVRQIDQVHDAENQGQPGRQEEQHDTQLKPVQDLL